MRLNQYFIILLIGIISLLYFKPSNKLLVILFLLTIFYLHRSNYSLLENFKSSDDSIKEEEEKRIQDLKDIFEDQDICNLAKQLGWKPEWPKSTFEKTELMKKDKKKYNQIKKSIDRIIEKLPAESANIFEEAYSAGELEIYCPNLFKTEKQISDEIMEEKRREQKRKAEKGNVKELSKDILTCREEKPFPQTCYFKILSRKNDKAVEVGDKIGEDKFDVFMWENTKNNNKQLWYSDKIGRIKSVYNNMCLMVDTESLESKAGNNVILSRCVNFPSQRFLFNDIDNGRIKLEGQSLFLEIKNDSNNDGARLRVNKINKDTGENQKWYIKSNGMPKTSKILVDNHNALENKFIENKRIEPSNEYSYHFWMYLESGNYRKNLDKHILHKGPLDYKFKSPGIWISPYNKDKKMNFKYTASTNASPSEFKKSKANVPIQKWIHVAYILDDKKILFYLNGDLDSTLRLDGLSNNNEENLYITYNKKGFNGELKNLKFHNYALTKDEIRDEMMKTHPEPLEFGNVTITKLTSNYTPDTFLDIPNRARLHNLYGWKPSIPFGSKPENIKDDMYLEARFDQYYQVDEILTQGHGSEDAWITRFKLDYFDFFDQRMKSYNNGQIISGNTSNVELVTNEIDVLTNKIRIYPMEWYVLDDKISIGLRVGFKGKKMSPNKCSRKLSICECDALVEREHKDYANILEKLNRCKNSKYKADIKYNVLKERVKSLEESMMQKPQTVYLNQIKDNEEEDKNIKSKLNKDERKNINDIEALCNHLKIISVNDESDTAKNFNNLDTCKAYLYKRINETN